MKPAIKKILLVATIAFTNHIVIAQTPYDNFAPSSKKKEMLKLPDATFRAYNIDTTREIKYIELDKETFVLKCFNKNDSLVKTAFVPPTEYKWLSVDPKAAKYPNASPYNFVNNNPILNIDPDGRDWFKYKEGNDKKEGYHWQDGSTYNLKTGVDENGKDVFKTLTGYKAVVVFEGSMNEKLGTYTGDTHGDKGKDVSMTGEGAVLAQVTIYGTGGAKDITRLQGYTMSSDPTKFGVVADGEYDVNRVSNLGPYDSPWAVNNRGSVPAQNNFNPAFPLRNPGYLTNVFIHSPNNDGWTGTFQQNGKTKGVSEGCLLIAPNQWNVFNQRLENTNNFHLQINR